MKHLDLFSGIGGFALAADRVFGEVEHTFVEIDPFCQEVLKNHWPNSNIYGDIRTITADTDLFGRIHRKPEKLPAKRPYQAQRQSIAGADSPVILTGGFPCQPFSQAGRRKGTEDDRHLWPEMLRVIQLTKPEWVIAENVRGILTIDGGMVFEQVCLDLEGEGYEVQPLVIPAVSLNAPHRRDRVWFVAHKLDEGLQGGKQTEREGHIGQRSRDGKDETSNPDAADTKKLNSDVSSYDTRQGKRKLRGVDWNTNWLEVATELCRVDDGLSRRLDRNPRLKALGNAIVPQVAEQIMRAIAQ